MVVASSAAIPNRRRKVKVGITPPEMGAGIGTQQAWRGRQRPESLPHRPGVFFPICKGENGSDGRVMRGKFFWKARSGAWNPAVARRSQTEPPLYLLAANVSCYLSI